MSGIGVRCGRGFGGAEVEEKLRGAVGAHLEDRSAREKVEKWAAAVGVQKEGEGEVAGTQHVADVVPGAAGWGKGVSGR